MPSNSKYYAPSSGLGAANAIQDFLMQRELQKQQEQEAEFRRQQAERIARQQAAQLELQQQQESRIAAAQAQQQQDLETERGFRRATTIATSALPDDPVDDSTASLLREHGYGGQIRQGQPTQGPQIGEDEAGVPQYQVTPGILQMRGGSQYLSARAAEQARAAQAKEAADARAAQAAEALASREAIAREGIASREAIAGMANQGRSEITALRGDLLEEQVKAAQQKAAEREEAKNKSRQAAKVTADQTVAVLKELADFDENGRATLKDATKNLFGARNPLTMFGKETNDARAALNRVRGRVIVDLLNEMKNQSATGATGFGALSGPELELLQNAASELNSPLISNDRAAQELERIYSAARRLYGTGDTTGGNVRMRAPDGRELSVPASDVQRLKALGAVEF